MDEQDRAADPQSGLDSQLAAAMPPPTAASAGRGPILGGYRGLGGLATTLTILFALFIVNALGMLLASVLEYRLYDRWENVGFVDEDTTLVDALLVTTGLLYLAAYFALVVVFIIWFYRAYSNLRALGAADRRFGDGWAIGAWFVPILNLFRPKQMADDAWRGSDPTAPPTEYFGWRTNAVPALLHVWWGAFLVAGFVGNAAARLGWNQDDLAGLRTAAAVTAASAALDVVAALLAVVVVRRLTKRQEERAARLRAAGTLAP